MVVNSVFGITDKGTCRERNEDSIAILNEKGIYIVADGMGGHSAGDKASAAAVESIKTFFNEEIDQRLEEDETQAGEVMIEAAKEAHFRLKKIVDERGENETIGSTIAIAMIRNKFLHTCSVGDSRIYLVNNSCITQITNDHSDVGDLVRDGVITAAEARVSSIRNQLTQALGASDAVRPEYHTQPLRVGDTVLICSDGLWDMLSDEALFEVVSNNSDTEKMCRILVENANEAGGFDNISVIAVKVV